MNACKTKASPRMRLLSPPSLKACGCLGDVNKGKQVRDEIISMGLLGNDIVLGKL